MISTTQVSDKLKSVEAEIKLINNHLIGNGISEKDRYHNPKSGKYVGSDDYTFSDRLYTLIGERNALKFVLGKN